MAKKNVVKEVEEEVVELDGLEIEDDEINESKVKANPNNDDEYEAITVEDRIVSIEKKTNTILILVIIAIVVGLLNALLITNRTINNDNSDVTSGEVSSEEGYSTDNFDKIKGTDIEAESKGKTIVVLMARQSCGYCVKFAPILEKVQNAYGFKTKYIDLTDIIDLTTGSIIDEDSKDALFNLKADKSCTTDAKDSDGDKISCADFMENEFGATPLTLVIKDNKLIYALAGYVDETTLKSKFDELGLGK